MAAALKAAGPNVLLGDERGPVPMTPADLGDPRVLVVKVPSGTTRLPRQPCPRCGELLTATNCLEDPEARPTEGSPSVCVYCGAALIFDAGARLHLATRAELRALSRDVRRDIVDMQTQIRARSTGTFV